MNRRRVRNDAVYVVAWPDSGVFKVGYSAVQRWRQHVSRGAQVVRIFDFDDPAEAFFIEEFLQDVAKLTHAPAFHQPDDLSRNLLGHKSSGYLECFLGTAGDALSVISQAMHQAMLDADAQVGAQA